jgi:SSS family solute:Na+ symporter
VFFAGSPTAGEGSTAQRFMAARNERHAMAGQLFNCLLALSLRILPLIGVGLVALTIFWPATLASTTPTPAGMTVLKDPISAWGELIKHCHLRPGLVGLLVAVEVAAYTSTLSALLNWGGSFVINDLYRPLYPKATFENDIWVSRCTTIVLFVAAAGVAMLFVKQMVGWFMFINSAMVIFLLPLSFFRFFWWRFNVWGELAAVILGLPLSILVWFGLDFQNTALHPMWHGLGLLFALSFVVLIVVTLLTPAESPQTLMAFYTRCRPPGFWAPVQRSINLVPAGASLKGVWLNCTLGTVACLGLVLTTNALFLGDWLKIVFGVAGGGLAGGWLIQRMFNDEDGEISGAEMRDELIPQRPNVGTEGESVERRTPA